jgi:hypothetical protein
MPRELQIQVAPELATIDTLQQEQEAKPFANNKNSAIIDGF